MAIEDNKVVSIEYEVRDSKTSDMVDSNVGQAPLTFLIGKNQIVTGLENHIKSMSMGEKSDVLVSAADGYGEYNHEAVQDVPREQFAGIELQDGMALYGQGEDGSTVQVTVKSFDDANVKVDYNHPMAGKDLMFTVAVTMVRDASADEVATGQLAENTHDHGGDSCGTDGGGSCGCH